MPESGKRQILTNIQVVRAFAAINVVFFHIIVTAKDYGYPVKIFEKMQGWGSNGVDLFFVVSGFIMVFIGRTKKQKPGFFLLNRIERIVPTYYFLTAIYILIILISPSSFRENTFDTTRAILSFLFSTELIEKQQPILFVGWTLEIEMIFYILFACSLYVKSSFKQIGLAIILIIITMVLIERYIMLEFIFGMMIGVLYSYKKFSYHVYVLALFAGITLLLFPILFDLAIFGGNRIIVSGVPSALIVFGCTNIRQTKSQFTKTLGDASYSIYLVQVFTVPATYKFFNILQFGAVGGDLLALACLVTSVLGGLCVYIVFEMRVSRAIKRMHTSSAAGGGS